MGFPRDCLTSPALWARPAVRAGHKPLLAEVATQSPLFQSDVKRKPQHDNEKRQWRTARYLLICTAKTLFSASQKVSQLPRRGNPNFWEARLSMTWPSPSLIGSFSIKKCYIRFTASARWEVTCYDLLSSLAVLPHTSAIHLWHIYHNICPSVDMNSWPSLYIKY